MIKSFFHVVVVVSDDVGKEGSAASGHQVTNLAMAVQDAVHQYVPLVGLLLDNEETVLIGPVGVVGFQAFDGGHSSCGVIFCCDGKLSAIARCGRALHACAGDLW